MFNFADFVEKDGENLDLLVSIHLQELLELPVFGYYVVQGEEYRPELIAHKLYGDMRFWWLILFYNGLKSTSELVSGITIKYPAIDDIEKIFLSKKATKKSGNES